MAPSPLSPRLVPHRSRIDKVEQQKPYEQYDGSGYDSEAVASPDYTDEFPNGRPEPHEQGVGASVREQGWQRREEGSVDWRDPRELLGGGSSSRTQP